MSDAPECPEDCNADHAACTRNRWVLPSPTPHTEACDDEACYCPDDAFWSRLLGDKDPCAPGKDWVAAAFGPLEDESGATHE